jgi:tetratricopeptide (TPR) repeat protein
MHRTLARLSAEGKHLLNLATVQQLKHDLAGAEQLARQALQKLDEDHATDFVDAVNFLGKILQKQDKLDEAEECFKRVHSFHEDKDGEFNSDTLDSLARIAFSQHLQGSGHKMVEAEANYLKALDGLEVVAGWSDGKTNLAADNLAKLYLSMDRVEDAQMLTERIENGLKLAFGEGDSRTLQAKAKLADILAEQGKHEQAIHILEQVLSKMDPGLPAARVAFMQQQKLLDVLESNDKNK